MLCECLAVVWSVLLLQPSPKGCRLIVRTDHDALEWILNVIDATGKLVGWRLGLSQFEFDVVP